MNFKPKAMVGDIVYVMHDNKIYEATVTSIDVNIKRTATYVYNITLETTRFAKAPSKKTTMPVIESKIFTTLDEIVDNLQSNIVTISK